MPCLKTSKGATKCFWWVALAQRQLFPTAAPTRHMKLARLRLMFDPLTSVNHTREREARKYPTEPYILRMRTQNTLIAKYMKAEKLYKWQVRGVQ